MEFLNLQTTDIPYGLFPLLNLWSPIPDIFKYTNEPAISLRSSVYIICVTRSLSKLQWNVVHSLGSLLHSSLKNWGFTVLHTGSYWIILYVTGILILAWRLQFNCNLTDKSNLTQVVLGAPLNCWHDILITILFLFMSIIVCSEKYYCVEQRSPTPGPWDWHSSSASQKLGHANKQDETTPPSGLRKNLCPSNLSLVPKRLWGCCFREILLVRKWFKIQTLKHSSPEIFTPQPYWEEYFLQLVYGKNNTHI